MPKTGMGCRDFGPFGDLEAMPLVEPYVLLLVRVEPARLTFGVGTREHGAHQVATDPRP